MMVEESLLTIGLFCWLFLSVAREHEQRQELLDYADAARSSSSTRRAPPGPSPPGAATSSGAAQRRLSDPHRRPARAPRRPRGRPSALLAAV